MLNRPIFSVLFLLISLASWAQSRNILLSDHIWFRLQPTNVNDYLVAGEHRFGVDSSWVELLRLHGEGTAEVLAAYSFEQPQWSLSDGTYGQGGIVVSGMLNGGGDPHLVRFANDGSITWTKSFTGMQFDQSRFAVLLTNGFNGFAYSNSDNLGSMGMYRVRFDAESGNNVAVVQVTTSPELYFRIRCGAPADDGYSHVLGGYGADSNGDYKALLGRFDDSGGTWMKLYELGSIEIQSENIAGVVGIPGGGYACAMNMMTSPVISNGIIMITDDDGQPIAGTRLSGLQGVSLSAITRLPGGDLLVAGTMNFGADMLFKLSSDGTLLWSKRCDDCWYPPINSFDMGTNGAILGLDPFNLYEIAPDGDACGFETVADVTATPFMPTVADITPVNDTAPAVAIGELTLFPRTSNSAVSVVCNATAIPEQAITGTLVPFPVPVENILKLDADFRIPSQEQVLLFDMRGIAAFDGPYHGGIDVSGLAPGIYVCLLPRTMQRVQVVKR